jgi:predicted DNA-binding transcriptional regulator AlpA
MTNNTKWRNILFELENEFTRIELENETLKERLKQIEGYPVTRSKPEINRVDWVELEAGKRFLTTKDLGKYLGLSPRTISNRLSNGVFPIRHRKMGKSVRFDMREILEYLNTNKPFWERDRESKKKMDKFNR